MSRLLLSVPLTTSEDAAVALLASQWNELNRFDSPNDFAIWTHPLLQEITARHITRARACHFQRYLFKAIPVADRSDHWAILSVTATLGQLDTTHLTLNCVRWQLRHLERLRSIVLGGVIRTPAQLQSAVAARRAQLGFQCEGSDPSFLGILDRAAEALTPYLRG